MGLFGAFQKTQGPFYHGQKSWYNLLLYSLQIWLTYVCKSCLKGPIVLGHTVSLCNSLNRIKYKTNIKHI